MHIKNYLTIDVEEYFQVAAFSDIAVPETWHEFPSRIVRSTEEILSLLRQFQIKATFFIVGWTAERNPELVRRIAGQGHGIGCHSYFHRKIYDLSPEQFRQDTLRAKNILEAIIRRSVTIYRAPSYSITKQSLWALPILAELGFQADSSVFPITHDLYGIPDAPRFSYVHPTVPSLREFPLTTARISGKNIPIAGGGYFRLFPYWFSRFFLKRINTMEKQPFTFYLHPWELDPEQPRFRHASRLSRFRHYNNLAKTRSRFIQLLRDFHFQPLPAA